MISSQFHDNIVFKDSKVFCAIIRAIKVIILNVIMMELRSRGGVGDHEPLNNSLSKMDFEFGLVQ